MSDSVLKRIADGDPLAVQQCLDAYSGLVWSIARRMLSRAVDAEDAVQEVFIDLWRSAGRFDPEKGSEAQFVTMVARRRLIDRLRRQTARPEGEVLPEDLPDPQDGGMRAVETGDEARRARAAFAELSSDQRRVIELAVLKGQTHREIAESIGMPLGTVKTNVRRGLIRMRGLLGVEPSPTKEVRS